MDGASLRPYAAPALDEHDARACEVTVRPGVRFSILVEADAEDPISRALASGHWPLSGALIELLEASAPRGGRVLDLGTHLGAFTLGAAALGYEVLAVEASPRNAALLQASIERNGFRGARLAHAAVSDRPGHLEFFQHGPYGHVAQPGSGLTTISVPALAIDDLLDEHGWDGVDFIKMDIEGSEVAGLKGMARRLGRPEAPALFVESNGHTLAMFGQTPASLKATLEGFGYRNYLAESGRLRPAGRADFQPLTCVDYLATKDVARLESRGWRVDPPMDRAEVIGHVLDSCRSPYATVRAYIARALKGAGPAILGHEPVRQAVRDLQADASPDVRRAARAVRLPSPWRSWMARRLGAA
jgi:FkbM family methyltransferase